MATIILSLTDFAELQQFQAVHTFDDQEAPVTIPADALDTTDLRRLQENEHVYYDGYVLILDQPLEVDKPVVLLSSQQILTLGNGFEVVANDESFTEHRIDGSQLQEGQLSELMTTGQLSLDQVTLKLLT